MNKTDQTYDRPREKVLRKGVAALSDTELLQLMIGSGTGKQSASKIAKKTVRLLKRFGSAVTYEQLKAIDGLGPARTSQLLAIFELASRYPVNERRLSLRTDEAKYHELAKQKPSEAEYVSITLDGAGRLLRQRKLKYDTTQIDQAVRAMCADAVSDNAAHLQVGRYRDERILIPTLSDLSAAKSVSSIGKLLGFTTGYIIFNAKDWHSVTKDVSHVER